MLMQHNAVRQLELPMTIPFPTLAKTANDLPFDPQEQVSVRRYYECCVFPQIREEQAQRSLDEDRVALNRWEDCTGNPDIREVGPVDLERFRDGLIARGCKGPTINKYWRELKAIFADAEDRGLIPRVPSLGRRRRSRLVKESPKMQRECITVDEVTRLWRACAAASYPAGTQFPAPKLWRVAVVLFWTYGARTLDMLRELRWDNIRFNDRLIQFEAMKTTKLQGLPITEVVERHLRSIRGHAERVFPGFNTPGCFLKRPQRWKRGYYTTWRSEITAGAGIEESIILKNFRESVVTRYNGIEPGLGAWIAAHHVPGVTAMHYDLPTQRIRQAIESAAVPECFCEVD